VKLDSRDWILFVGLLAVLAATGVLGDLGRSWWNSDHMSHGFLVPLVAWFVAAGKADTLAATPARVDARGLAALVLALAATLAGKLGGYLTIAGFGVVASVVALVWFRRGGGWLRALTFPLAYLLFMVPPPPEFHDPFVTWLQGRASEWSVATLYALGVPVYLEGYIIQMVGGLQVEVAQACSGATSLYTLAALGTLLAFVSLKRNRTRAVLIALVFPAALIGNLARVVVTVLLCLEIGVERATTGAIHSGLGLLIYVVAVTLLLAADGVLRTYEKRIAA
jgi:exosortase